MYSIKSVFNAYQTKQNSILLSILICISANAVYAQEYKKQDWDIGRSQGITLFHPDEILSGKIRFAELPEIEHFNTVGNEEHNSDITKITNFLKHNGIALGLGVNPNRDSFFDLYSPNVDILLQEPSAQFGYTEASEVGKMHFLTHDSVHLYSGSPALTRADLKDPNIKDRLQKALMRTEALASAWTAARYIKWYWNWRDKNNQNNEQRSEYQKYNNGIASYSNTAKQREIMEMMEAYMSGKIGEMFKLYSKNINYDTYIKAKEAGVPMMFPDLQKNIGGLGEKLVVKYVLPLLFPLHHMYDPKFGYVNLIKYAAVQSELYLSEWYVEWTDLYKIGKSISEIEQDIERKINDFKNDNFFSDVGPPAEGVFEMMAIRNNVINLGRKLIELKHLERQRQKSNRPVLSEEDWKAINSIEQNLLFLNEKALSLRAANRKIDTSEVLYFKTRFEYLLSIANKALSVDRIIPIQDRLAHADYSLFWNDPFAVVLKRPEDLTKFLSARGIWRTALQQRVDRLKAEARGKELQSVDLNVKPVLAGDLEKQIAFRYNENRKGDLVVAPPAPDIQKSDYLQKLSNFNVAVKGQIEQIFIPQLREFENLNSDIKDQIISAAIELSSAVTQKMQTYNVDYQSRFIEFNNNENIKNRLYINEMVIKTSVDQALHAMANLLDHLEQNKKANENTVRSYLGKIIESRKNLIENETTRRQFKANALTVIKSILAKSKSTKTICSLITKICMRSNLTELESLLAQDVQKTITKNNRPQFIFTDANNNATSKLSELPKDAIVVFAMNYDHGSIERAYLLEVQKMLGIDSNAFVTSKESWPHIAIAEKMGWALTDESNLLVEDKDLKTKVLNFFEARPNQRVAVSMFPEGQLPLYGTQFPLHAKYGAFNYARAASALNKGKRPVYIVNVFGNFLRSLNSNNQTPIKIVVQAPELVPDTPLAQRDEWVEKKRLAFESESNSSDRRGQMIDLIQKEKVKNEYTTDEVRKYKTAGEYFMESVSKRSCQKIYSN
jgi:hypothetical protein